MICLLSAFLAFSSFDPKLTEDLSELDLNEIGPFVCEEWELIETQEIGFDTATDADLSVDTDSDSE